MENNPFKVHGIEHLSPSSINTWIQDPCYWILTYLFNKRSKTNVSALRGIALEKYYADFLTKKIKYMKDSELKNQFDQLLVENHIDLSEGVKEQSNLIRMLNNLASGFEDKDPLSYQEKIEVFFEDCPIPIMGYIDFVFKDKIVDLKTTTRMPSIQSEANNRQLTIYGMAHPNKSLELFYVSQTKTAQFKVVDTKYYQSQIYYTILGLMKFLSISSDRYELASFYTPNFDDWKWSAEMKNEATKIWRSL
jgi:hypothetical protein